MISRTSRSIAGFALALALFGGATIAGAPANEHAVPVSDHSVPRPELRSSSGSPLLLEVILEQPPPDLREIIVRTGSSELRFDAPQVGRAPATPAAPATENGPTAEDPAGNGDGGPGRPRSAHPHAHPLPRARGLRPRDRAAGRAVPESRDVRSRLRRFRLGPG